MNGSVEMVMFLALIILIIIISRMIKHSRSASGVKSENYISRNTPLGSPITGLNKNADKTISGSSSDLCPHCKGSGKMLCPWCSGFGRRICGSCGGSGKNLLVFPGLIHPVFNDVHPVWVVEFPVHAWAGK